MELIPLSFIAGILTVASPCVLPLLPVIISGSLTGKNYKRAFIITISLTFSIILFTILLKVLTIFITIEQSVWGIISGTMLIFLGIVTTFPEIWEHISVRLKLGNTSNSLLQKSSQASGTFGSVLIGLSLGPVFASCSPTYLFIVATVIPQSIGVGIVNLSVYSVGLALTMMLIAILGKYAVDKLRWAANPNGSFRRILGVTILIVGILIFFGIDKKAEQFLIENGYLGSVQLDQNLLEYFTQE